MARTIDEKARDVEQLRDQLRAVEARHVNRPRWQHELDNASDAIREDLDNRTRNVRKHAAPEIVARLGPRPTDPERDWQWDRIAARVDQHRAAYQPTLGLLGRDNIYCPTAENDSIRALKNAVNELDRTLRPEQRRQRGIDHGIDHGIEM